MAKSKPAIDSTIVPPTDADLPTDPADVDPQAEIERLKAELAAKTAEADAAAAKLAELQAAPPAVSLDGPKRKFVVSVQDAPTWVVEAVHESLAFEAYKAAVGMIATSHQPTVRAAADDAPLGRHRG